MTWQSLRGSLSRYHRLCICQRIIKDVGQVVVVTIKQLQSILVVVHSVFAEVLPTANDNSREKYNISTYLYGV